MRFDGGAVTLLQRRWWFFKGPEMDALDATNLRLRFPGSQLTVDGVLIVMEDADNNFGEKPQKLWDWRMMGP